jgi:hypothetical protein
MRLDEEKLETLRRWGRGLVQAGGDESAAAGRAILMLIEEIDQLQFELRLAHQPLPEAAPASMHETAEDPAQPASTLQGRLQRMLRRDVDPELRPEPLAEAELRVESDSRASSPQSWIEALRRQK